MNTPTKLIPHTLNMLTLEHTLKTKPIYDDDDSDGSEDEEDRFWNEYPKRSHRKQRSALTTRTPTSPSDPEAKEEREWSTSEDESRTRDGLQSEPKVDHSGTAAVAPSNGPEKRKRGRPRKESVSDRLSPKRTCVTVPSTPNRKSKGKPIGPNPNRTDKTGRTKLFYSTGAGHFDKVKHLVSMGADVNFKDNAGWTPLHEAALKGQLEIARFLISQGADVNARGFGDETPLHDAACNSHAGCVQLLMDKGADVFAINADKQTPLDVCDDPVSKHTLQEKMKQLDRLVTLDGSGRTTLHRACIENRYDDVASLLELGANVNAKDNLERTPLHDAASHGRLAIVKLLIKHGAAFNDADNKGDTILHSACRHGHTHIVQHLIDAGVDIHACNQEEKSAYDVTTCATVRQVLSLRIDEERQQRATSQAIDEVTFISAAQRRKQASGSARQKSAKPESSSRQLSREERKIQAIMRSFEAIEKQPRARGRSSSTVAENGRNERSASPAETALVRRAKRTHQRQNSCPTEPCKREDSVNNTTSRSKPETKKYDPHKKDTSGRTQLHKHSKRGDIVVVEALLKAGADPNEKDNAGWTALHEAALQGHLNVMTLLLANGANVNSKGADQDTPLHDATENSHAEVVMLLLEHGADPHARNTNGIRPLDIAIENGDKSIANMVQEFAGRQGHTKKRRLVQAAKLESQAQETMKVDTDDKVSDPCDSSSAVKRKPINVDVYHHRRHGRGTRQHMQGLPFSPLSPDAASGSPIPTPPPERLPKKTPISTIKKEEDDDSTAVEPPPCRPLYTLETVQNGVSSTYVTEWQTSRLLGLQTETLRERYTHLQRVPMTPSDKEHVWPSLARWMPSAESPDDTKQGFFDNGQWLVPLEQIKSLIDSEFCHLRDRLTLSAVHVPPPPPIKCGLPPKFALKMQKCGRLPSHRS